MIRSFRKFFEFAGRQSRNWYLGLFYEIIRCILEALQFAALLVVLDGLVRDNITTQTALLAFGIMLVSVIGTIIFWYLAHGKEGEGSYRMCEDKRIQIGNRMKYMPMGYFNSHSLGNLTSVSTATMSDLESMETLEIVLLPSKYLMHQVRANRSPNTIRRNAFALAYYWEYLLEEEHEAEDVYGMDYETQYDFFAEYLKWLKAGKHTDNLGKEPQNKTCNAYLKEVFRFYSFLEVVRNNGSCLSVLSYNQPITKANAIGVRRTIRSRSFKGYLKEEERNVRAAERNEIVTILEACTNCRDQVLILLTSELGFRIGEILGIDYTKDIDYENHEIRVDFRDDNENDARAKNAEERRGRVSDDTFEFLLYYIGEYWDILQKQEYLFINIKGDTIGKPLRVDSVYDMFERMEKKTGIKITPHMLRRYYANTRWEADWPLEMISQALGHKHLDTTIRYLNVLDDKLKTASQEFYRRYSKLYGVEQFLESRR